MLDSTRMLAAYNQWANRRLYDAADALTEAEWRQDCGAFFRSLCGTLNHLVVADRIWLRRLTGTGDAPDRLDATLAEDRPTLRTLRDAEDARLLAFVAGLDDAALAGTVTYRTITNPQDITQPLGPALLHVFNHQTHHRGQAHAILTRLRGEAPSLDLLLYQRETGDGL